MNVQNMAKQANFTHASEALDFLVNQAAKDNVTDEEAVREMAAYLRVKSEIQALQQQLAAAREALQSAEALITKWRDSDALHDGPSAMCACADDLAATLQRDRQP